MREMERLKQEHKAATIEARDALLAERGKGVEEAHGEMEGARSSTSQDFMGVYLQQLTDYMRDSNLALNTQSNVPATIGAFAIRVIQHIPYLIKGEQKRDNMVIEEAVRQWTNLLEREEIELGATDSASVPKLLESAIKDGRRIGGRTRRLVDTLKRTAGRMNERDAKVIAESQRLIRGHKNELLNVVGTILKQYRAG